MATYLKIKLNVTMQSIIPQHIQYCCKLISTKINLIRTLLILARIIFDAIQFKLIYNET